MLLKMFCVFDIKAGAYLQPMFFRSTNEAIRAFSVACEDDKHEFHKHAEDYVLYEIGQFHDDTGTVLPLKNNVAVMTASQASTKHREFYAAREVSLEKVVG